MFKKILLVALYSCLLINVLAQSFSPNDTASAINFTIKNFGINVIGSFKGLNGNISFDPVNLGNSVFDLRVEAATVNTGIDARDNHLKKEEYFDVNKFPFITFLSTKVSASGKDGIFIAGGNITIKGITKNISFPFTATARQKDYVFKGTFKLNRRDFHVGSGSLILSDNLVVSFSIYATNKS